MDKEQFKRLQSFFEKTAYQQIREELERLEHLLAKERTDFSSVLDALAGTMKVFRQDSNQMGYYDLGNMAYQLESECLRVLDQKPEFPSSEDLERMVSFLDNMILFLDFYNQKDADLDTIHKVRQGLQVSAEMLQLFEVEVYDHIDAYHQTLIELDKQNLNPRSALEEIYRAVHSIKGDSNALGFKRIGARAHKLENQIQSMLGDPDAVSESTINDLFQWGESLKEVVEEALAEGPSQGQHSEGDPDSEQGLVSGVAETALESEGDEIDAEITQLFTTEAQELLDSVAHKLLQMDRGEIAFQAGLDSVYRSLHTLKGNANALGFVEMGKLAHHMEDKLSLLKQIPEDLSKADIQALISEYETLLSALKELKLTLHGAEIESPTPEPRAERSTQHPHLPELLSFEFEPRQFEGQDEITVLYVTEAQEIMAQMRQELWALQTGELEPQAGFHTTYRMMHTLKGNSNALGFADIGALALTLERRLSQLKAEPSLATLEVYAEIFAQYNTVARALADLVGNTQSEVLAETQSDEDLGEEMDEITVLYVTEARDILEQVSKDLLAIEQDELDPQAGVESIYRSLHTLKGNSNALGFGEVGTLAHQAESRLQQLRKHRENLSEQDLSDLYKYHHTLQEMLNDLVISSREKQERQKQRQTWSQKKSMTQRLRISQVGLEKSKIRTSTEIRTSQGGDVQWRQNALITTGSGKKKLGRVSEEKRVRKVRKDDDTIRVSVQKIDQLINLSDELLIHKISYEQKLNHLAQIQHMVGIFRHQVRHELSLHNELMRGNHPLLESLQQITYEMGHLSKEIKDDVNSFNLTVNEIQYHSRNSRMLPCSVLVDPLRLVVRSTSQKLDKAVEFVVVGEETEIDRFMVEKLKDPLGHLIRNAVDHGIETTQERAAAGKPENAQLLVQISLSGNQIVFLIQDDGRGINYEKVRQKAIKAGLVNADQAKILNEAELNRLIFSSGFSTAEQVSEISGRGVGLDVVRATIEGLNGQIEVLTEVGKGTQFRISLPVTLTTFDAFLIRVGTQKFAVPRTLILATRLMSQTTIQQHQGQKIMLWGEYPVPLRSIHEFIGQEHHAIDSDEARILLLYLNQQYLALVVDEVLEARPLVMKQLGSQLKKVPNVSGATILGEGEPVVVLDLQDIFYAYYQDSYAEAHDFTAEAEAGTRTIKVLVVDDSVTTRTLEKNILEAAGFEVTIATNGQEARQKLPEVLPQIIITDCEMPVMDGYEFTSWVKKESEFSQIPMIMVTSLAEEEFKRRAFEAGVDDFIVKGQFKQEIFLTKINRLLEKKASLMGT